MKHMVVKTGENTTDEVEVYNAQHADNATHADSADSAVKATQDGNGDNIAATYAKQNGTYPNLAAGEAKGLSKVGSVYADSASRVGWHKFAEVPLSALTAVSGTSSYSAIVLVNGLNPYQGGEAANSGIVEVDMRVDGSRFTSSTPPQIKLLSGNVDIQKLCFKRTDTEVGLYINTSSIYVRYSFTVLDERYYLGRSVDAMEFADEYYGAAAPDGAVYATNVNQAAYAQEAAMLDEAYKAGNSSGTSLNGYVKLIDFTAGNNWAEKTLRLEFGDDNVTNAPQNPCGMEMRVQWNSSVGVSPRAVLLYGDKQIADKLYVSYTPSFTEGEENTVSVYYKVSDGYDMVAYKPLYMTPRQGTDVTGVNFYQPTQSDLIAELPSGNTNTAITALENFRDLRYAKYDADGNDISDTYATKSDISNPNLIINPDFKINQRNRSGGASAGYCRDRWFSSSTNIQFYDDYVLFFTPGSTSVYLIQYIEKSLLPSGNYVLSIMCGSSDKSMTLQESSFVMKADYSKDTSILSMRLGIANARCTVEYDVDKDCFAVSIIANGANLYVKYIKLEIGDTATKFIPPDPIVELAKCQRYFVRYSGNGSFVGVGFSSSTTVSLIEIALPVTMRTQPTVTLVGVYLSSANHFSTSAKSVSYFQNDAFTGNMLKFEVSATGLTKGETNFLQIRSDSGYIDVDAEL